MEPFRPLLPHAPSPKEIFFHVGLGKTATTYLQYKFFPRLKGVYYIQRTRYRNAHDIIRRTAHRRYLVSREFDQQLEREVSAFARPYPNTRILIVFRRHDSWIASQYRRFAKNGIHSSFQEFFDIEHDRGAWKRTDLNYMAKLQIIETYFHRTPLVLFQEDLKTDAYGFFDQIAGFIGASYDRQKISLAPVHTAYNDKQLKAVRRLSTSLFPAQPHVYHNAFMRRLQWRRQQLTSYCIMFVARFLPEAWIGTQELIPSGQLKKIREYYHDDWEQCRAYARTVNRGSTP